MLGHNAIFHQLVGRRRKPSADQIRAEALEQGRRDAEAELRRSLSGRPDLLKAALLAMDCAAERGRS